ncbi:hypothetical protein KJ819_02520 [Patescibacteria group bacterium]|nr:hypothetical protein [Patescibacteria group bacterium]MBU1500843.1 hypothetical protein [Patescibacteria group bacterium]MBU2080898.1 hypothetical protein [Patescibacteria group bacterium]MBU2124003.1 hypothetical protein [Patescibacteria group bacterium]MBU2194706.1 hypothetical protein [Patescibacteria group bacterium]
METNQKNMLIGGGVLVLILLVLGGWYLASNSKPVSTDTSTFRSKAFWFDYPRTYDVREFETGAVLVGSAEKREFTPLVQVMEYKSDPDEALPVSYEAFVRQQALALCGSDDSKTNVECADVVVEPFTSLNAFEGLKLTMSLVSTDLETEEVAVSSFGPIYAFDITKPGTAEDPLRYSTIFVNPTLAATLAKKDVTELLNNIVDRLVVNDGKSGTQL